MLVQARFVRVPGLLSGDLFSLLWLLCHDRAIGRRERRRERPMVTKPLLERRHERPMVTKPLLEG